MGVDFFFLISSERSGSNLMTRLMDGHSAVCGPSPTHLFRTLLDHRSRYGDLAVDSNWHNLLTDTVALFESKLGDWDISISLAELKQSLPNRSLAEVLRHVYHKEASARGKHSLFIKENDIVRHFAFLDQHFNGAQFVFLVRDPRDMALSWKLSSKRGGVVRAAAAWQANQADGLALFNALEPLGRIAFLRYEDLISDPTAQLKRICSALGLEYEPDMERLDADRPHETATAPEWANLDRPIMTDNRSKYRGQLTAEEIQFIESTCAVGMASFSYEPDYPAHERPDELKAVLEPLELWEKPQYLAQPEEVRKRLAHREAVVASIAQRPVVPLLNR